MDPPGGSGTRPGALQGSGRLTLVTLVVYFLEGLQTGSILFKYRQDPKVKVNSMYMSEPKGRTRRSCRTNARVASRPGSPRTPRETRGFHLRSPHRRAAAAERSARGPEGNGTSRLAGRGTGRGSGMSERSARNEHRLHRS